MVANYLRLQVNVFVVFLGAATIIALLKISSYFIPTRYYFSFSELIGGGSEPFLVDPPAVTGQKLCDIISTNNIASDIFSRHDINCSRDYVDPEASPRFRLRRFTEATFSNKQIHQIYEITRSNDAKMRAAAIRSLTDTPLDILSDDGVDSLLRKEPNARRAFNKLFKHYADQVKTNPATLEALTEQLRSVLAEDSKKPKQPQDDAPEKTDAPADRKAEVALSDNDIDQLVRAHRLFFSLHGRFKWNEAVKPITKATIDKIVEDASPTSLPSQIAYSYADDASSWLLKEMRNYFDRSGVRIPSVTDERLTLYKHILSFSYGHYIIAVLFRIAPVFLFGAFMGLIAGRAETLAVSMASALAGFLLSWPLMLMWDRLVHSRWSDKYELFVTFYIVFIMAFFATGRAGVLVGVWLREYFPRASRENRALLTAGYVALNVGAAAALNIFAYAINSAIPLVFGE